MQPISTKTLPTLAAAAALAVLGTQSQAAVVTFVGSDDSDTSYSQWRTASNIKALDVDEDNIYGTDGYIQFATDTDTDGSPGGGGTFPPVPSDNPYNFSLGRGGGSTILARKSIPGYASVGANPAAASSDGVAYGFNYPIIDRPGGGADIEAGVLRLMSPRWCQARSRAACGGSRR